MKKAAFLLLLAIGQVVQTSAQAIISSPADRPEIKTANGWVKGIVESSGIRSFKGIPYARPPVGSLRWRAPEDPENWKGIRDASHFGPQAMQRPVYSDMMFRSKGKSEDCLYLNVWTPAKTRNERLPVLVYFYGGGLVAGDGSEYRYDGENMAKKGIVTITLNYRLGVFGFLAHPQLTKESTHHSSGNYGLMDQHAALLWVRKNIAAFGGDPERVTIGGESAGSMSVSAQMASPLSTGLFAGAIAESGSIVGNRGPETLPEAEKRGVEFTTFAKVSGITELREIPAEKLLELSSDAHFGTTIDGYFIPHSPVEIYSTGKQMDVPLLAGWNSAEVGYKAFLGQEPATVQGYKKVLQSTYGEKAGEVFKLYPAPADSDVIKVATDLASDRFIAYSTWKFIDLHGKTDGKPVYRYLFSRPRPAPLNNDGKKQPLAGASHASEIEYALGNLGTNKTYSWTNEDYTVSAVMESYFANFIKKGDPNGQGLPIWYVFQSSIPKVMVLDVNSHSERERNLERYKLLDSFNEVK